jgi:hypothetical protein
MGTVNNREAQHYGNHKRFSPLYHYVMVPLILLLVIVTLVHLISSPTLDRLLLFLLAVSVLVLTVVARLSALTLQDRLIREEENNRYLRLTGQELDTRLTLPQVIALRFASDEEYADLAARAVAESMSPKAIKQAIKNWRADHQRV